MLNVFAPVEKPVRQDGASGEPWTVVELALVVKPGSAVYMEWPADEPMVNVIAMMQQVERGSKGCWRIVFDPEDEDMLETLVGGYRLHGMFVNELI